MVKSKGKRGILSRLITTVCIVLVLVIAATAGLSIYVVKSTQNGIYTPAKAAELSPAADDAEVLIVVLGCGVYPDGSPTPMLRERVAAGAALYKTAPERYTLLMSGDHAADDYAETRTMKRLAEEAGAPDEAMLIDRYGLSTYDSVRRIHDQLAGSYDKYIIVSQRYHLHRALYIADSFDLDAIGLDATETRYSGQWLRDLREIAARAKDFIKGSAHPAPTRSEPILEAADYE